MAGEIADIGYAVPEDVKAAVDQAEQLVFDVGERRTADPMRPLQELLGAGLDRIEELGQRGSTITGVATGYHELDHILLGLQPSSLIIVGARPGMGKTSFALGVLANVGLNVGRPALLFSLEMGHLELTQRLLASEAEVNGQSLQTGRHPDAGLEQDRHGGHPPVERADLHRRQPERHGHGHPGPGPAAEEGPRAISGLSWWTTCS